MPLTTMILPEGRARFSEVLERVFQGARRTTLQLEGAKGLGRPPPSAELLLLPLQNDRGDNPLALGCLATRGSIGRAPRRMEVTAVDETALEITAPALPTAAAPAPPLPDRLRSKGFAEPAAAPFTFPAGKPGLRLVDRDD